MAYDETLAGRVRERLAASVGVTEKKMFGGLAFMTNGNMTVGVNKDDLIVRLDPTEGEAALAEPGVRPFDMTPRPMAGWVMVAGEMLDGAELDRWVDRARRYADTLPPK
jgi:TfoX/Sxy family transcriptional regulator of competence genes